MKHLKLLSATVVLGLATLFQGCKDDDGYSVGDMGRDLVTTHIVSNGAYTFTGDSWGTMWPGVPSFTGYRPVEGERAILYFNPLYDNFQGYDVAIKVENIQPILTKNVEELTAANEREYADDPVRITDAWISGGYMNIIFHYIIPQKNRHRVSLVENTTKEQEDDGYIHLEYRYNTYGDTLSAVPARSIVSYNLNTLDLDKKNGIKLRINSAVNGKRVLTFDKKEQPAPKSLKDLDLSESNVK